jgi:hypothetical protein
MTRSISHNQWARQTNQAHVKPRGSQAKQSPKNLDLPAEGSKLSRTAQKAKSAPWTIRVTHALWLNVM